MLRVLSFNIQWHKENTWDSLSHIIDLMDPDMVFLQEVQRDAKRDMPALLQNKFSKYMYVHYSHVFNYQNDYGKWRIDSNSIEEWLCVMSKEKIVIEYIELPIMPWIDRRPRGLQYVHIENKKISHIHLSKIEKSRSLQRQGIPPSDMIIGDFNMQPQELSTYGWSAYAIAYQKYPYISYPSKKLTLDHCLIKGWSFESVVALENDISDHNAIFYTIVFE